MREFIRSSRGNTCPCLSGRVNNDKLDLIEESKALSITLHYNSLQCRALLSQSVLSRPDVTFWNEPRRFDKSSSPRNFLIASLSINRSCRYFLPFASLSFAKYSRRWKAFNPGSSGKIGSCKYFQVSLLLLFCQIILSVDFERKQKNITQTRNSLLRI